MSADLHIHSTASDGRWSPLQLVHEALSHRLTSIAITDHDTLDGVTQAMGNSPANINIIPGLEISTDYGDTEVHILGYWIDVNNHKLTSTLQTMREARVGRTQQMVAKLNNLGIAIEYDDVKKQAGKGTIGRAHLAKVLQDQGFVVRKQEAFDQWIGVRGPAYVPRFRLSPQQAIELIRQAGGVAVLAHPGLIGDDSIIFELVDAGLQGIEVIQSAHSQAQVKHYQELATRLNLLPSGGSDCHGPGGKDKIYLGDYSIPDSWVDNLHRLVNP